MGSFTPFIYLIIYLYKYVPMNKYLVIWVLIKLCNYIMYFVCLKFSSFEPWKIFLLAPVPLWHSPAKFVFCALSYFLLLPDTLDSPYMFPATFLELSISSRSPGFSYWRLVLESKIWVLGVLSNGVSFFFFFLVLSANRGNKYVCIY